MARRQQFARILGNTLRVITVPTVLPIGILGGLYLGIWIFIAGIFTCGAAWVLGVVLIEIGLPLVVFLAFDLPMLVACLIFWVKPTQLFVETFEFDPN